MMEYCRFGDISKCYPDPLSEVEARRICGKLVDSLVVLHGLGITHRDIKPQVCSPSGLQSTNRRRRTFLSSRKTQ